MMLLGFAKGLNRPLRPHSVRFLSEAAANTVQEKGPGRHTALDQPKRKAVIVQEAIKLFNESALS